MSWLCSGPMVEAQHPAEPLDALDCANSRSRMIIGLDQPVFDALVIPLPVQCATEFRHSTSYPYYMGVGAGVYILGIA